MSRRPLRYARIPFKSHEVGGTVSDDLQAQCRAVLLEVCDTTEADNGMMGQYRAIVRWLDVDDAATAMARAIEMGIAASGGVAIQTGIKAALDAARAVPPAGETPT